MLSFVPCLDLYRFIIWPYPPFEYLVPGKEKNASLTLELNIIYLRS